MLTTSFHWLGTRIEAAHGVEPEQFEPGLPDEEQAHAHLLDLELAAWTLDLRLGLTERLGVELEVPYREVRVEAAFEGEDGQILEGFESIHHRNETISGVGDVRLLARYRWRRPAEGRQGWVIDFAGGLSLPTGNTEPDPFELGEQGHEHQHIFFGSGTADPILAVGAFRQKGTLQMAGWLRVQASLYDNSHGYRAGERLSAGFGFNPSFGLTKWSFLVQAELYHEEPAQWANHDARNSGRTDALANLGVFWLPNAGWDLHAIVKIPENLAAQGGQLELSPMLMLGATYSFDLWNGGGH